MKDLRNYELDLHLHDGAAAAGGEGDNAGGEGNSPAHQSGAKQKVVYGKAAEGSAPVGAAGRQEESQAGVAAGNEGSGGEQIDFNAKFDELIKGDYRDAYRQKVQAAIDRRFKNQENLQSQLDSLNSVVQPLMEMYETEDMDELRNRILTDNGMFEEAAEEMGMTVDQYAKYMEAQRRMAELQAQEEERNRQEQSQALYRDWEAQGEALKEIYPEFDLNAEVEAHDQPDGSNEFIKLLGAGIGVKEAYEVLHLGEIMTSTAQQTGEAVRKQTTETIRARGMRPAENGLSEQPGVIRKSDPGKLTAEDRKEIAKRVRMGETISF